MNFLKNILKSPIVRKSLSNKGSTNSIEKQDLPFTLDEERNEQKRTIVDQDYDIEDIFSQLVLAKKVSLPEKTADDREKLTLFLPLDEVLLYTYLPDENMGLYDIPKSKKFDMKIELRDYKTFAFIYFRDHLEEFLNYVDEKFETILYSTGEKKYVDKILDSLQLESVFRHRLYQENCHLYQNPKEDKYEYLKDINLITNRSLKRKVLLETSTLNLVISPDNIIPVDAFHPDDFSSREADDSLKVVMDVLDQISDKEDVREILRDKFDLRQTAINSKLL